MANLPETPTFDAGVYQIETSDRAEGGVNGAANRSAKNLANRTNYLKFRVDGLEATIPNLATIEYVDSMLGSVPGPEAVQEFSGNGTWTKPDYGRFALVRLWGGGGAGGRMVGSVPGGGSGGCYAEKIIPLALLPSTVPVIVGAGGPGRATNGDGANGGDTTFGTFLTAKGGLGGKATGQGGESQGLGGFHWGGGTGASYSVSAGENPVHTATPAASSVFGGGGGGTNSVFGLVPNGLSTYGGAGGQGGTGVGGATAGAAPGGGGGGSLGFSSGAGGNGRCEVVVI